MTSSKKRVMDRNLALEAVRVTEAAALAASMLMGRGDEKAADQAAVDAMLKANAKSGVRDSLIVGLKLTTPLYHTAETAKLRPFRVSPNDMTESFTLLVDYGGLDKSAGRAEDYYSNDYLP